MKITKLILAAYLLTSMAACDTDKNIAMYGEDSGAIRIEASINTAFTRSNPGAAGDQQKQFNEGDVVYFVSSSIFIKKATVVRNAGGFCTIRFEDGNCGTSGTRVRESKLYRTEEEAKKVVQQHQDANKRR